MRVFSELARGLAKRAERGIREGRGAWGELKESLRWNFRVDWDLKEDRGMVYSDGACSVDEEVWQDRRTGKTRRVQTVIGRP